MKFSNIAILCLFFTCNSFAADGRLFQYIELSKVINTMEEGDDTHGFKVAGKYEVIDYLYLNGSYSNLDNDFLETKEFAVGIGAKYDVNNYFIPFAQVDYLKYKVELESFNYKDTITVYRYGVGLAGAYNNFLYKLGVNRYASTDSNGYYTTREFVETSYIFGKSFSVLAKVEFNYDDDDNEKLYTMGARYHF